MPSETSEKRGFTAMELIVVVAVLSLLAAVIIPVAVTQIDKAKITKAQNDVNTIIKAVENFRTDVGTYPYRSYRRRWEVRWLYSAGTLPARTNLWTNRRYEAMYDHLVTNGLMNNSQPRYPSWNPKTLSGWHGPYLTDESDPWGRSYLFLVRAFWDDINGGSYYGWVISAGPDETLQTDDTASSIPSDSDDIGKWIGFSDPD